MAWISVHESVNGTKLRKLYKKLKCSKAEALGILCFVWFWGLNNADKNGKVVDADAEDIADAVIGVSKLPAEEIVNALFDTGWLDIIDDDIYIHDWKTWQEQWYKAQEKREYDVKRKRDKRIAIQRNEETQDSQEDGPADGSGEGQGDGEHPAGQNPDIAYTPAFELFWDAYPRKVGKGDAYKKYKARRNDGFSDAQLLSAAENYKKECDKCNTEKMYIKHPKTFLSDSLPFLDFLPKKLMEPVTAPNGEMENPFEEFK